MILDKKNIQKVIKIDKLYNEQERRAIGQEILDYIRKTAAKGISPQTGKPFKAYSDSYKKSLDYKNVKGRSEKVTLSLSGDMLAELDVIENKKGELTIGYETDNPAAEKAEGNQIGSYGQDHGRSKFARPFIKINKDALAAILKKYPINDEAKRNLQTMHTNKLIEFAQETTNEFINEADLDVEG